MMIQMDYINITAHQTHLPAKDGMVGTVIGKDELDCITVSNPHTALTKERMAASVHSLITREPFSQMPGQPKNISTATPTKCDWMKDSH
jgi:hypothetical protein